MTAEGQVVLPSQFGRYTLIERLAMGGMAEVFRAKIISSHGFEKVIVIKRILPHLAADPTFVSMFIDEAKLTAQLTHPKIVQVLDFGEANGQYFIALEYIDGYDALGLLRAAAKRRIRVPLPLIVFVVGEILDALDYAHTAVDMDRRPMRLVHRDISPSNIFISRHGDVRLGDFGIAHTSDRESQTQAGTLKGKYGYMSPEQVTGAGLDARSDLFAVGIVLAEAFMGRRLFTAGNDLDVLLMVRDCRIDRLNRYAYDLPPELDRIVRKALLRDPALRYQTAAEFREDLWEYLFSQKLRIGSADVRGFMQDLFDGSPEALVRTQRQGRGLPEAGLARAAGAGAALATRRTGEAAPRPGVSGSDSAPAWLRGEPTPRGGGPPRGITTPPPTAAAGGHLSPQRQQPGDESADATATSHRDPFSGLDIALVDLDHWSVDEHVGAPPPGGFSPVSLPAAAAQGAAHRSASVDSPGRGRAAPKAQVPLFVSAAPDRPPDSAGDLGAISAMRVFADVTVAGETGLLRFERGGDAGALGSRAAEVKEVFLLKGSPECVNSSVAAELFGAYLVARRVLRPDELELALSMLPQFSGKLGDTLVGLHLMRPLEVFRQLSQQVRDRVIDLFRWTQGTFAFYRGVINEQDGFPLGLDGFEILGAGVLTVPSGDLENRFAALTDSRPKNSGRSSIHPDAFNLGPTPSEVLALLDGHRTLGEWLNQFSAPDERTTFLRSLYLLIETDLAQLDE